MLDPPNGPSFYDYLAFIFHLHLQGPDPSVVSGSGPRKAESASQGLKALPEPKVLIPQLCREEIKPGSPKRTGRGKNLLSRVGASA